MATLKGILFSKYVDKGLNSLLEELQKKYGEKKGRRFNYNNITYEVSRSSLVDENIQFEISSKIPQDELKDRKDMKGYFNEIKKLATKFNKKPIAVEMENIIIDTKKNTEKKRDYVKLLYSYPLDELYSEKEILKKTKGMKHQAQGEILSSEASGALTQQGNLALQLVKESIQSLARQNIEDLLGANKKIREKTVS
tara:strand:+ start:531 stop:1118 length:588 start_codon:yes stop_codon:yes gene_type:complete